MLKILKVETKTELREFIHFTERRPNGRKNWVPPIWSDEHAFHDPSKNPSIALCRTERWLAKRSGVTVGRIMGIIHDQYNKEHGEKSARFFGLECDDDQETAHYLLDIVETWAKEHGMDRIIGPFGFSDKDPEGIQIEGLEHRPVIATATNAQYLSRLVESKGYDKFKDCLVYRLDLPDKNPDSYEKIARRVMQHYGLRSIHFNSRWKLRSHVVPVFRLLNEAYKDIYGFVPMSEKEMKKLRDSYLPILDPKFVKLLENNYGEPVAFVIAVPDFSEGLQKCRGRLFPFGFLKIFKSMRKTHQLDLLLGAVRPDLQGKGITAALAVQLFSDARRAGFRFLDSHLVLESNERMRSELERIGGVIYKRYRIYSKNL